MVYLAGLIEVVGGVCLIAGFAVRWLAVPLMVTLIVAAVTAHWKMAGTYLPRPN